MNVDTLVAIRTIVRGLQGAIQAQSGGRVLEIGHGWDDAAALEHDDARVSIALSFWEGWADSAAHSWRYYEGLSADDWPRFAEHVIDALSSDTPISDPVVLAHFGPQSK